MKNGQHRAVGCRIEKLFESQLVASGRLGLAIAYHAGHDQVGIVEGRTVGMNQRVAQLAALVDRAWSLRRNVAGNAVGQLNWRKSRLMPSLFCSI